MHTTPASHSSSPSPARRGLWWAMTILCVLFAPLAAEFYLITINEGTATYARILEAMIHADYAYGEASGLAEMKPYWQSMPHLNQVILGVHALLATIALLIGPLQFSSRLRTRRPRLHKVLGRLYFALGVPAMLLSIVYLCLTPMRHIYGGPPFAVGLWGIAILTLYTFGAGLFHILRGTCCGRSLVCVTSARRYLAMLQTVSI